MKAWLYKDDDDMVTIYYAETRNEARMDASCEYDENYKDVVVHRVKWADQYSPNPLDIPDKAWIENGCKVECANCGNWVGEDDLGGYIHSKGERGICRERAVCKECWNTRMGFGVEEVEK